MIKSTITSTIQELSQQDLANIQSETKRTLKAIREEAMELVDTEHSLLLRNAKDDSFKAISQKKRELILNEKLFINQIKNELIDTLLKKTLSIFESLSGKELLNCVASLINKELSLIHPFVNTSIMVPKNEHAKYLHALSTNQNDLDLLHKKLSKKNITFTLSNTHAPITSGFLLVGVDYDLSFEFKDLIQKALNDIENQLLEILFS